MPVRCAGSTGGVELACIAEDDDADDIEASSGSELDTASTGMASYSTDATSKVTLPEEGAVPRKEIVSEKVDGRVPIPDETYRLPQFQDSQAGRRVCEQEVTGRLDNGNPS